MVRRLLLSGIPGTGKTRLGEHLHVVRGFRHIDMESDEARAEFRDNRATFVDQLSEPVVLTWGFHPVHDVPDILYLKQSGFWLVWLDGDRPAALREFILRGTVDERWFYLQLWNIESTKVLDQVNPDAVVNPFDANSQFRPIAEVATEVIDTTQ